MIIYIDYECYWDEKTFSLSKMGYEQYVRDPRFEPHLLSVAIDDGPVYVYEQHQIRDVLEALPMERPDVWTVAHNVKFDGTITTAYYGKYIANPLCSMNMMRWTGISRISPEHLKNLAEFFHLPPKGDFLTQTSGKHWWDYTPDEMARFKAYSGRDVEALRGGFKYMLPFCTLDALEFMIMTDSMYITPKLLLDEPMLAEYEGILQERTLQAMRDIMHIFRFNTPEDFKKAIKSPAKFSSLLTQLGATVPVKLSAKQTKTKKAQAKARLDDMTRKYWALSPDVGHTVKQYYLEEIWKAEQEQDEEVYIPALAAKDLDFIALQDDPDERVALLCQTKAKNNSDAHVSRCKRFLDISRRKGGYLPVPLEALKAQTGRYTAGSDGNAKSDSINLQNLNKHKGDKTIRKSIIAPPGHLLVAGDSAQIEARVGAWVCCEDILIEGFARKEDVYCDLAGTVYSLDPLEIRYWAKGEGAKKHLNAEKTAKADKQRFIGKTGILSSQYQISGFMFGYRLLQDKVWLGEKGDREYHEAEAKRINNVYRNKYRKIVAMWKRNEKIIAALARGESGYFGGPDDHTFYFNGRHSVFGRIVPAIIFPDGFPLLYPNLRWDYDKEKEEYGWVYDQMKWGKKWRESLYGGKLLNNIVQGFSSSILRWQALQIRREGWPINMNCHDEWMGVVLAQWAQQCRERYEFWMRTNPPWAQGVPLDCELGIAENYGGIE